MSNQQAYSRCDQVGGESFYFIIGNKKWIDYSGRIIIIERIVARDIRLKKLKCRSTNRPTTKCRKRFRFI